MSIALLIETQNEVRRLLIAGSELAPGDFRLKKLMPAMAKAGESAAVFARVADLMGKVVAPADEKVSEKLLELANLINAVLYTQGQTGIEGEHQEIECAALGLPTVIPFRRLKPVIDALTNKGAGRLEMIRQAYGEGIFKDLRLVNPLIYALNDNYFEIAELVSEILEKYGAAIVPVLKAGFDFKGGKGYARRLDIVSKLAGRSEKEFILKAVEEGTDEVKVSAIKALKDFPECEPLLLELSRERKKDIKEASLLSLAALSTTSAIGRLFEVFNSKERNLAAVAVRASSSKSITGMLLDEAEQGLKEILKTEKGFSLFGKKAAPPPEEVVENFAVILECMQGKKDEEAFQFLMKCLEHTKHLKQIKLNSAYGYRGTANLAERVGRDLMLLGTEEALKLLDSIEGKYDNCLLGYSFEAALRLGDGEKVFDRYAGYAKKGRKSSEGQAVLEIMDDYADFGAGYRRTHAGLPENGGSRTQWDSRWTKILVELGETALVCRAISGNDAEGTQYLLNQLNENMNFKDRFLNDILRGLMQAGYPEIMGVITQVLAHNFKKPDPYLGYYFNNFISVLQLIPAEGAKVLEAFASTLNDELSGKVYEAAYYLKTESH